MSFEIRKASRPKAKLRIGLSGSSSAGKTYSALLIASGITSWDKIFLIDSENGRGEYNSDLGEYNYGRIQAPFTPEKYIEAINKCEEKGAEVIIIDSVSHEWEGSGGCLEINEKTAQLKFKGNSWSAWSETTPRHQKFLDAIIASNCHIITTARSKVDSVYEGGKVKKIGTKEIQREGYEYEMTINFMLDREKHYAIISKDTTGIFINSDPFVITPIVGEKLLEWSNSGSIPIPFIPDPATIKPDLRRDLMEELVKRGAKDPDHAVTMINGLLTTKFTDLRLLTDQQAKTALEKLNDLPF